MHNRNWSDVDVGDIDVVDINDRAGVNDVNDDVDVHDVDVHDTDDAGARSFVTGGVDLVGSERLAVLMAGVTAAVLLAAVVPTTHPAAPQDRTAPPRVADLKSGYSAPVFLATSPGTGRVLSCRIQQGAGSAGRELDRWLANSAEWNKPADSADSGPCSVSLAVSPGAGSVTYVPVSLR